MYDSGRDALVAAVFTSPPPDPSALPTALDLGGRDGMVCCGNNLRRCRRLRRRY